MGLGRSPSRTTRPMMASHSGRPTGTGSSSTANAAAQRRSTPTSMAATWCSWQQYRSQLGADRGDRRHADRLHHGAVFAVPGSEVYTVNIDGSNETRITTTTTWNLEPSARRGARRRRGARLAQVRPVDPRSQESRPAMRACARFGLIPAGHWPVLRAARWPVLRQAWPRQRRRRAVALPVGAGYAAQPSLPDCSSAWASR